MDKAHKEEEAQVKIEIDKKHLDEQLKFRRESGEEQAKLKQLILNSKDADDEISADMKALQKYEDAKKAEHQRRVKAIELQKQEMQRALDKELKQKYEDYDSLV